MNIEHQAENFLVQFTDWANNQHHIKGVALVGSFARGGFHSNSDIDLTIISENKNLTTNSIRDEFKYRDIEI